MQLNIGGVVQICHMLKSCPEDGGELATNMRAREERRNLHSNCCLMLRGTGGGGNDFLTLVESALVKSYFHAKHLQYLASTSLVSSKLVGVLITTTTLLC